MRMLDMDNKDTITQPGVVVFLDEARVIRFTMRASLLLEDAYGTVGAAFDAFKAFDSAARVRAIVEFLYAVMGALTREQITDYLFSADIAGLREGLIKAISNDFPQGDGGRKKTAYEKHDWDWLYYVARYRLLMSDDEFWNCTPKRFWKLARMWSEDHGLTAKAVECDVDEIPGW